MSGLTYRVTEGTHNLPIDNPFDKDEALILCKTLHKSHHTKTQQVFEESGKVCILVLQIDPEVPLKCPLLPAITLCANGTCSKQSYCPHSLTERCVA